MNAAPGGPPGLALAAALDVRREHWCRGLRQGEAELFELVTPTTTTLLRWWFGEEACAARGDNFDEGQRRAILNTIIAHEVLACTSLLDLCAQVCPEALAGIRRAELPLSGRAHPRYGLALPGEARIGTMLALLLWQLLNKSAALRGEVDDPRFTRHFLLAAAGPQACERLRQAIHGPLGRQGRRNPADAALLHRAALFLPPSLRAEALHFVLGRGPAGGAADDLAQGLIAIVDRRLPQAWAAPDGRALQPPPRSPPDEDLAPLAELGELMVFVDEGEPPDKPPDADDPWLESLAHLARGKGRRFVQVDLCAGPQHAARGHRMLPRIIATADTEPATAPSHKDRPMPSARFAPHRRPAPGHPAARPAPAFSATDWLLDRDAERHLDEALASAGSYEELLRRLARRIGRPPATAPSMDERVAWYLAFLRPGMSPAALAERLDTYVREQLFGEPFDPRSGENWRLLKLRPVSARIVQALGDGSALA
ncbi:hypothetical protein [Frateuria defendens]|uniref:hypothetical protein n=1 Tax=Frateuria defendens TaxID=2219559 RepID=UPI00066FDF66|nr:hypothetical protein [Frateuria defendens]